MKGKSYKGKVLASIKYYLYHGQYAMYNPDLLVIEDMNYHFITENIPNLLGLIMPTYNGFRYAVIFHDIFNADRAAMGIPLKRAF